MITVGPHPAARTVTHACGFSRSPVCYSCPAALLPVPWSLQPRALSAPPPISGTREESTREFLRVPGRVSG